MNPLSWSPASLGQVKYSCWGMGVSERRWLISSFDSSMRRVLPSALHRVTSMGVRELLNRLRK